MRRQAGKAPVASDIEERKEARQELEHGADLSLARDSLGAAADNVPQDAALPPVLVELRATLRGNADALAAFDDFVQKKGAAAATVALPSMARSSDGLAALLLRRSVKAVPVVAAPYGAAAQELDALAQEIIALSDRCARSGFGGKNFRADGQTHDNSGAQIWVAKLRTEAKLVTQLQQGGREATPEVVNGIRNNVGGVRAELESAERAGRGALVNNDVFYDASESAAPAAPSKLDIDVISPDGTTWIEVKNKEPFGLESSNWSDEIQPKAQKMLEASQVAPHKSVVTKLVFDFPKGVSAEVRGALMQLGFEVRGDVAIPRG